MLEIASIFLVLTAALAYLNHRFIGLPTTIGVMTAAMLLSLALVGLDWLGFDAGLRDYEQSLLRSIDFSGYLTFRLLRSVDNYHLEVLLTLAAVLGGYALALRLGVSGPLAMVVVGLMIGNEGRALAMSDITRRYIDGFWELVDEILNAALFVLIGMEVMVVTISPGLIPAASGTSCSPSPTSSWCSRFLARGSRSVAYCARRCRAAPGTARLMERKREARGRT
jgi:hypothetical protein